jgi:hypothetical protein
MADEYGVCRKTFNKLLLRRNMRLKRGLISPLEQMQIYTVLGEPGGAGKFPDFPINSH